MRRALLSTCLLPTLCVCGCKIPYCVYTALDYTPRVKIDSPPDEVRAFRVDICKATGDMSVFRGPGQECLSEIPVSYHDEVPAQFKPSVTYGFVVMAIALNYLTHASNRSRCGS